MMRQRLTSHRGPVDADAESDAEVDVDADAEVDAEAEANDGESQMADTADEDPKAPTS